MYLKIMAISATAILLINMVLFGLGKISTVSFWVTIILAALFAYYILPRLKKIDHEKSCS